MGALIPGANPGGVVLVVGAVALVNKLGLGRELWRRRLEGRYAGRGALLVLGGLVLYGIELWCALTLLRDSAAGADGSFTDLAFLLLGVSMSLAWDGLGSCWVPPRRGS